MAAQQQGVLSAGGWREPAGRHHHSTAVVGEEVYLWAGKQHGMPRVHDSAEKRSFLSSVEVFKVNTGCWEQRTTRGTPPLGAWGYSCVAVRNDLYYFGGGCSHFGCYHNSVHTLSTSTLQWRMLAPTTSVDGAPMKKSGCGVVHFTDEEGDLLFVVGGYGPIPSSRQHGTQYKQYIYDRDRVRTNEQHIFCLSTSGWSSLKVTGQAPPPCSNFTLTTVGEKRAAMYGGWDGSNTFNHLFIVELERHSVHWSNISTFIGHSVEWPRKRIHHAATHLSGPLFMLVGGVDQYAHTLKDMWLCDTTTKLWKNLPLPGEYVTERWLHSVSTLQLGPHCMWLILFGGYPYKADTVIIELIQGGDGEWSVERVLKRDTLSNNTVYQDKLREGRRESLPAADKKIIVELEQEIQHVQEKTRQEKAHSQQMAEQRTMELEEGNHDLHQQARQLKEKAHSQQKTEQRTRELEEENHDLHQQARQLEKDSHRLQQQLDQSLEMSQQAIQAANRRAEEAQQRIRELEKMNHDLQVQEKTKDVPVSGSEGVEMEEHEAGSGGGEDPSSLELSTADVIHAYDASLRASKEKEQQLQSQLASIQQESQDKEQQLSKLEDENCVLHKEMVIVKYENEQQQEELKRLQQKAGETNKQTLPTADGEYLIKQAAEGVEMEEHEASSSGGENSSSLKLTEADVIHAYDVSLRASKKKEQQLQSQLATVEQESQDKEQQLSKLEDENCVLHKELAIVKYENEQQQEELKRLQQKAGEDEVRVTASKEEQQRLVQQYQRMGHARDVQISQLRNENELVQDKYGALKASYLQLKAASNEKQSVDTIDTGVQADYLAVAPGFLRGVEVYGETVLVVVGDKPQKLEWPGYGFYMEVPEGALASGVTASVGVKVILSGQFKLPDNRQLISAIYWISSSEVFLKEVAINIQHFAVVTSEEQCSKFSFIIARCSQKELPYTFRAREGSFNPHTQYGAIKLKQFSVIGQTGPEDTELHFTSLKFYKPIPGTLKVDFVFIVIHNHELFLECIRKDYCNYWEDRQNQMLVFEDDTMVLDLPAAGSPAKIVDGWKILPLIHPEIAKVNIQEFKPGRSFPACTIELEWTENGEPKCISHQVNIIGAKKPHDYFYMRYYPQAVATDTSTSALVTNATAASSFSKIELDATPTLLKLKMMKGADGKPLKIIETVAAGDYMTFGMCLLQDENGEQVGLIERDQINKGTEAVTRTIIQKWLTSGAPTRTYQHLIECLRQSELGTLAGQIAAVIDN